MSAKLPPVKSKPQYNQSICGFFGEFGSGGGAQCVFLQTGISVGDVQKISLVSEIPGSEHWPVRDLFQREVDEKRVTNGLMRYLNDSDKVKFFNPLTLTFLPKDRKNPHKVVREVPELVESTVHEDDMDWEQLEYPGFYRFRMPVDAPQYAKVEWNDAAVKLVAIDGQHRLSALKRCLADPAPPADLGAWTVPAVLFGLRRQGEALHPIGKNVLDYVRNIFVYINSTAKAPNLARTILLSDEDSNMVCLQELLQDSHSNDCLPIHQRDPKKLPLLFFDWRGLEEDSKRIKVPGTLYVVEEVYHWIEEYILGEALSTDQRAALEVQPTDVALQQAFSSQKLGLEASLLLRKRFREQVMPGISYFLQSFKPFSEYVTGVRKLESELVGNGVSDFARHAFMDIRFGSHQAGAHQQHQVNIARDEIVQSLEKLSSRMESPLNKDIGPRGVVCAFGNMKKFYRRLEGSKPGWMEYSRWFTRNVNKVYDERWLDDKDVEKKDLRNWITHTTADTVLNYRLQDAQDALGAYVMVLVMAYAAGSGDVADPKAAEHFFEEQMYDSLHKTLTAGYRRHWRPILKERGLPMGQKLNKEVRKHAQQSADSHLQALKKKLDFVVYGE